MSDKTIMQPVHWISAQESNPGVVRKTNQDAILSLPDAQLWAVADGMGGHEAGDVASKMIIDALSSIAANPSSIQQHIDNVTNSLIDVNQRILEYSDNSLQSRTVGSTIVTLVINNHEGACLWAGDSRLYRYRNQEFSRLSRDHSHVQELLSEGIISAEEARNHPNLNIITRAIGTSANLSIDTVLFGVQHGDIYLLCSDGLYNMLSDDDIACIITSHPVNEAVDLLIRKALENGANDNVSVVLVKGETRA